MAVKKGLGKGLGAMIPVASDQKNSGGNSGKSGKAATAPAKKEDVSRETFLDIHEIEPNGGQPRKNFDQGALEELATSIKEHGVIQPLVVTKQGKHYEIIAGERRWRAARIAGLKKVPVIIREYTKQEIMEVSLIENIQRENLNPIEEAQAFEKLLQEFHLKQDEVAQRVGKSRTAVTNSMRLLKLDPRVQEMLIFGKLTGGHARAILGLEEGEKQYLVAEEAVGHQMSVREVEKMVRHLQQTPGKKQEKTVIKGRDDSVVYRKEEDRLKQILGAKVEIHQKDAKSGKIEIAYYSQDELQRILDLFGEIR